jgi:hypothetical protein
MQTPQIDDLDRPVWGAQAIATIIDKSLTQTHYLLRRGLLDAEKIGKQWASTPRRLLQQFGGGVEAVRSTRCDVKRSSVR